MIKTFVFLLVFIGVAHAAAPTANITCNRTDGVAPLLVICTSGAADTDATYPFLELTSAWSFGDASAGNWSAGANTSQSKNFASAPVAAHVYETAGSYTITAQVTDGTSTAQDTLAITVTDPDTVFSGTNTTCVSSDSLPVAGVGGCPTGAQAAEQSNFGAIASTYMAAGKRVLLKRGDTFTTNASNTITADIGVIAAYGSGAAPIIQQTNAGTTIQLNGADDWRIVGLEFDGQNGATSRGVGVVSTAPNNVLILDSIFTSNEQGVGFSAGGNGNGVVGSTIGAMSTGVLGAAYGVFGGVSTQYFAFMGNTVNIGTGAPSGSHAFRASFLVDAVIANNTVTAADFTAFDINAPTYTSDNYTERVSFTDNKIIGNSIATATGLTAFSPQNASSDERLRDILIQRNWFVAGSTTTQAMGISAVQVGIHNNLIDMSGGAAGQGINVSLRGIEPAPTNIFSLNNTIYRSSSAALKGINITTDVVNITVKNQLIYAPSVTTPVNISDGGATVLTVGENSTDDQAKNTSPSFASATPANPIDFRIGTGSYAATGGTAVFPASNSDFFNCDDNTANERIGAFVPRVRAQCRGVAGP